MMTRYFTRCWSAGVVFRFTFAFIFTSWRGAFLIRVHIGNQSLFLSGVFPERIRFRAEARGFPDLKYYERLGRTQYRMASDHRLAQRYAVANIFNTLAERFETTRRALNDIADRLFSIGENN